MHDHYPSRQQPEARFLPRLDPVVFGDCPAAPPNNRPPIDRALVSKFETEGFLILEDLFRAAEVRLLQDGARKLLADPGALAPETLVTEPGADEIRSIFAIHRQSALMERLAADSRLAGLAHYLLGGDVYIHQSRLNYKPGFRGREFYWHSDFETWHVEDGMPRMRALSMSVLLAENRAANGPLMLIPGSHRRFLSCVGTTPENHYRMSLRKQEYGVPDEDSLAELAHRHGITVATGKPGTVVVFDCNIMHGSAGNISPFPRSNAFFVYNSVDNRLQAPFGPEKPRPPFVAERHDQTPVEPVTGQLTAG